MDLLASLRNSQESSPTLQFKSISSLVLSFLYGPTLTFIHDYWKNHSFDSMDLVSKVMSLLFNMLSRFAIVFFQGASILESESESHSVMSNSLQPYGLYSLWNSLGQNTGVGTYPFSRGSSQPRDQTQVSRTGGGFFTRRATKEAQEYWDG